MEMFVPNLCLLAEPDGEYTLKATTLVPSPCYGGGPAIPGEPPPNMRLTPDVFPVLLSLRSLRMMCIQMPETRLHRAANLNLAGKRSVLAFVSLDHHVLGSARIPVEAQGTSPKKPVVVQSSDWHCWVSPDPQGEVLHVTGLVYTQAGAMSVSLTPASPQGINPRELILDIKVKFFEPPMGPSVLTPHSVHFQAKNNSYTGILIREPDGDSVHLTLGTDRAKA